jgi:hypothetical protein
MDIDMCELSRQLFLISNLTSNPPQDVWVLNFNTTTNETITISTHGQPNTYPSSFDAKC